MALLPELRSLGTGFLWPSYLFIGRLDHETGLYYYRSHYYSPRLGEFMANSSQKEPVPVLRAQRKRLAKGHCPVAPPLFAYRRLGPAR
jgi:hypothetical protein